jgi:hypothetical protein
MPTSAKKPIVAMATPSVVSHACIACPVSANGKPEVNPKNSIEMSRCRR